MKTPQVSMPQIVTTLFQANRLFAHQLAKGLVEAGVIDRNQAAAIMVGTANAIRNFSEDEVEEHFGAALAHGFEEVGQWLLRSSD